MHLNWKTFKDRPSQGLRLLAYVKTSKSTVMEYYALCYAEWTGAAWRLETDQDVSQAKVALWCVAPPGYTTQEIVAGYRESLPSDEDMSELTKELEVPHKPDPELEGLMGALIAQLDDREKSIKEGMKEFGLSRRELLAWIGDDREESINVSMNTLGMDPVAAECLWEAVQASKEART
jgi:hypothetical protein